MKVPYYAGAAKEPPDSPAGRMLASARHLSEHLGEAPVSFSPASRSIRASRPR